MAELDRRRTPAFVHPTSPPCWEHTSLGGTRPMLEFLFDTTRAVVDLVLNGTVVRYPDLQIIVPHARATLPVIADRVAAFWSPWGSIRRWTCYATSATSI
jgi:hypothetical protein